MSELKAFSDPFECPSTAYELLVQVRELLTESWTPLEGRVVLPEGFTGFSLLNMSSVRCIYAFHYLGGTIWADVSDGQFGASVKGLEPKLESSVIWVASEDALAVCVNGLFAELKRAGVNDFSFLSVVAAGVQELYGTDDYYFVFGAAWDGKNLYELVVAGRATGRMYLLEMDWDALFCYCSAVSWDVSWV